MPQPQPKPVIGVLRKGCKVCGRRGKLFLCGGCDCARYCSASCQTKDWSAHQADCVIVRASPSAKEEKRLYRAIAALDGAAILRDVEATGQLLRAALAAGHDSLTERPRLLAVTLDRIVDITGIIREQPTDHASKMGILVKLIVTDLIGCALRHLENPFTCVHIFLVLTALVQYFGFLNSEGPPNWTFHNEARRAGVLRLCADAMRLHRHGRPSNFRPLPQGTVATIQVTVSWFLVCFTQNDRNRLYLYQAHEVGLADCLKWALDNNLLNQSNLEDYQQMELFIRHVRECKSNPVDEDGYEHAASIYYYGPAGYHPAG